MSAFARTEVSGLLVHQGDVDEGCAGLAEMVDALVPRRATGRSSGTRCRAASSRSHRIGQTELAAEVLGAIEAHATLGVAPMMLDPARRRVRRPATR